MYHEYNFKEDNKCDECFEEDECIFNNGDTSIYSCNECGTTQLFIDEVICINVKRSARGTHAQIKQILLNDSYIKE